jgi:type I restriction enzyme S subunit
VIKLGAEVMLGVPTLRSSNVRPLALDLTTVKKIDRTISEVYPRTLLSGGEVLVTVRGTLGGVAVVPNELRGYNVSREVAVAAVLAPTIPEFVALCIASRASVDWLAEREKGAAYTGINIEDLRELPIPTPTPEEQREVVERVRALFALADAVGRRVGAAQDRAELLPQAMLSRAFAGELVPTEADLARTEARSYEAAEHLLEKIRADRDTDAIDRKREAPQERRKQKGAVKR